MSRETVRAFMSTHLVTVAPETSIHVAMDLLIEHEISGLPVVDARGNLVGLLSERDCLEVAFRAGYHRDFGGSVADYMESNVETLAASDDIVVVIERFLTSHYRRFPVMDGTRLAGILSRRDVLRAVKELW